MTLDEGKLQDIRDAIQAGDRSRAKEMLTRHLRRDPDDAEAWVWMSVVVETPSERIYCLKEALRADPELQSAKRGLAMLGEEPVDPELVVPPQLEQRKWMALLEKVPKLVKRIEIKQLVLYIAIGVLAAGLIIVAVLGARLVRDSQIAARRTIDYHPIASATSATGSPSPPTPTSTPSAPTPPWAVLAEPYTATPAYVRTPHAIIESYAIAIRALDRQDPEKALMYMIQAATSQPDTPDLPYQIGELYLVQHDYARAVEAYNLSIAASQSFAPAYLGRAQAGLASSSIDLALARGDLENAITLDAGIGMAYIELARLDIREERYPEAIEHLARAEQLLPGSPWVYYLRGQVLLALGDNAGALDQANRANQLDLTLLPVYRLTGQALQAAGKYVESVVPFEIYLRYTGEPDAGAQIMMARAYAAAGDYEKALEAVSLALNIVPKDADVITLRGELYLANQRPDLALEDFRQALRLDSGSFDAGVGIGRAQLALGEDSDALSQFKKMESHAESDTQKAIIYYWRAQAYEKLNQPNPAMDDWQRLLDLPDEAVPAEWRQTANQHLVALNSPTPTATPSP